MIKVKDISDYIDKIAPYKTKCDWDNCGILVGDADAEVKKIAFALDLTAETLAKAESFGADLIVTHHPVIFKPQSSFIKGNLPYETAVRGINVISAHTCFDCATGGVNDVLCELLDIKNAVGVPSEECEIPMARIGDITPAESGEFASFVAEKLNTVCRVADSGKIINKVAVCGGSGMDFFEAAIKMGADAFVTGDVSHHHFLRASECGVTLIAAGHFETEFPAMTRLMDMISNNFQALECLVVNQSNPVKFVG